MGTHVISGTGKALVVKTGKQTEFGKVSERPKLRPQETEFERGVRLFGYFLMEVTLMLVIAIFAVKTSICTVRGIVPRPRQYVHRARSSYEEFSNGRVC